MHLVLGDRSSKGPWLLQPCASLSSFCSSSDVISHLAAGNWESCVTILMAGWDTGFLQFDLCSIFVWRNLIISLAYYSYLYSPCWGGVPIQVFGGVWYTCFFHKNPLEPYMKRTAYIWGKGKKGQKNYFLVIQLLCLQKPTCTTREAGNRK